MQNNKKKRSQNTIYSAKQEAIVKRAILTDSLSTMMAIKGNGDTKNPKTQTLRKMLDEEDHKGITGNKMADIEAKTYLLSTTITGQMAHHQSYRLTKSQMEEEQQRNERKQKQPRMDQRQRKTELTRATHNYIIEKHNNTNNPFL
jgi:hypothetical protein